MAEPLKGEKDIFDVDRIRRLIDLMKENDLSELDLRQDEQQIRLVRGSGAADVRAVPLPSAPVVASSVPASAPTGAVEDGAHIVNIKSPMVGTFYNRPNPKADAFVKVGTSIAGDTIICIIEAMKVFNEIPAEITGKIVAVLVQNEQAVEYGQPLFKVDTRG